MKFPYIKIPAQDPKRQWISRPIITVTLFGSNGSVAVDALIDSGADKCLFNAALGREIGLDLNRGIKETFSGIEGGQIATYVHTIGLKISGMENEIEINAGFAEAGGVFAILGQEGFFDNYRIKFERDHNTFEINPLPKK